jgi:hypothetical protein
MHRPFSSLSTVAKGTAYELVVQKCLLNLGLKVQRVGGAGDRGLDIRAILELSQGEHTLSVPVVGQCKFYENCQLGPQYIRELQGALLPQTRGTVGLLASPLGFTQNTLRVAYASEQPLALAQILGNGDCQSFVLNPTAQSCLPGVVYALHNEGRIRGFFHGKLIQPQSN